MEVGHVGVAVRPGLMLVDVGVAALDGRVVVVVMVVVVAVLVLVLHGLVGVPVIVGRLQ